MAALLQVFVLRLHLLHHLYLVRLLALPHFIPQPLALENVFGERIKTKPETEQKKKSLVSRLEGERNKLQQDTEPFSDLFWDSFIFSFVKATATGESFAG